MDEWVGQTLTRVGDNVMGWMLSNDESPDGSSHSCGHLKHILTVSQTHFQLLIHSVPEWPTQYPPEPLPVDHCIYAQSFVAITLELGPTYDSVLAQLALCDPNVYALHGIKFDTSPQQIPAKINFAPLTSNISHVAKSKHWNKDLYQQGLVPFFQSGVQVESWLRPANFTEDPDVEDLEAIVWPDGVHYRSHQDHSKWCISKRGSWTYIGSINHMRSQAKRGGDGIVVDDPVLHSLFASLIPADSSRVPVVM